MSSMQSYVARAPEPDPILRPFLQASDKRETDRQLDCLIKQQAEPVVQGILRRKGLRLSSPYASRSQNKEELDAEDVHSDALRQLIKRLYAIREDPTEPPITDFRGYVAVTTSNAFSAYIREKYPQRWTVE